MFAPVPRTGPARPLAAALLAFACLCWAGNYLLARSMTGHIPPVALSLWRWVAALVILLPITAPELLARRALIRAHWPLYALLGATGTAAANAVIYLALNYTSVINAALTNSASPAAMLLVSWLIDRKPARVNQLAGVAVSTIGVGVIITAGDIGLVRALAFNPGDFLVLSGVLCWAVYSVMLRRAPRGLSALGFLTVSILFGLPFLILARLAEILLGTVVLQFDLPTLGTILITALFPSIAAYLAWNRAVALSDANFAGPFVHLLPAFATILAITFLNERFRPFHGAGLTLILLGILLANGRLGAGTRKDATG